MWQALQSFRAQKQLQLAVADIAESRVYVWPACLQIFSGREKLQLDVYGLLAVLLNQIQTDDSFVLNRILGKVKQSIQHLPEATEMDDAVLHTLQASLRPSSHIFWMKLEKETSKISCTPVTLMYIQLGRLIQSSCSWGLGVHVRSDWQE